MHKIIKIALDDGTEFNNIQEAKKFLEKCYGNKLTKLCSKLVNIEKYVDMCNFVNENLSLFGELIELNLEMSSEVTGNEN